MNDFYMSFEKGKEITVPASVLAKSLQGLQRVIDLLAYDVENIETRKREASSKRIQNTYAVTCSPSVMGSYRIPCTIGNPDTSYILEENINTVRKNFFSLSKQLMNPGNGDLKPIIPDQGRRKSILAALQSMIPKDSRHILNLLDQNGETFFDSITVKQSINHIYTKNQDPDILTMTVTGTLSEIDFDDRRFILIYSPTKSKVFCNYANSPEIEPRLLENPREEIQVTGTVNIDRDGYPEKITEVDSVTEVDLSEIELSSFDFGDYRLTMNPPRRIQPLLDEEGQIIRIEDHELGIDVFAFTREELLEELPNHLRFLWETYALSDQPMTEDATRIKNNLLSHISEVQ